MPANAGIQRAVAGAAPTKTYLRGPFRVRRSLDERAPVQRLHHGEPPQWNALHRRDKPSAGARSSASDRPRLAIHVAIRCEDVLVWYEHYGDVNEAIAREKQLKKWERRWKLDLIETFNPEWADLYETLNG